MTRSLVLTAAALGLVGGLVPPLWERWIAMPRLRHWDDQFATSEELVLAADANRAAGWPIWQRLPGPPDRS